MLRRKPQEQSSPPVNGRELHYITNHSAVDQNSGPSPGALYLVETTTDKETSNADISTVSACLRSPPEVRRGPNIQRRSDENNRAECCTLLPC